MPLESYRLHKSSPRTSSYYHLLILFKKHKALKIKVNEPMSVKPYSIINHTTDAVKSQYFTLKHIIADPLSKQAS